MTTASYFVRSRRNSLKIVSKCVSKSSPVITSSLSVVLDVLKLSSNDASVSDVPSLRQTLLQISVVELPSPVTLIEPAVVTPVIVSTF